MLYAIARERSQQLKGGDYTPTSHESIWKDGVAPLVIGRDGNPEVPMAQSFTCDLCGSILTGGGCACQGGRNDD